MDEKNAMELSFRMHDQLKTDAEKTVRSFLVLKKIAEKEALTVADDDIDNHIKELAEIHHTDYEVVKSAYDNEERLDALKSEIILNKIFDLSSSGPILGWLKKLEWARRLFHEFDTHGGGAGWPGRKSV